MRALLDINVLIALHDRDHVHHVRAANWFETHIEHGWASCPLTQNGCLRIMSQPAYSRSQPMAVLMTMLQQSISSPVHKLWPDDISILDAARFNQAHIHNPAQLTDLYLLGLAVKHKGRLVTFDQRIALSAVSNAKKEHLVIL
jgi:uncharacterized protein